jgi:uridine kinase
MDNYFHERPETIDVLEFKAKTKFDNPEMLYFDELKQNLLHLHNKHSCTIPIYDWSICQREKKAKEINPVDVVIVEGTLALYFLKHYWAQNELNSITINITTSSYLDIVRRRIKRNTTLYQQSLSLVINQERQSVGPGFFKYTATSANGADFFILNDNSTNADGTTDVKVWEKDIENITLEASSKQAHLSTP